MNRFLRLLAATAAVTFALPLCALHPQWALKHSVSHWDVGSLASGDFNEDGLTDFITRTPDESVYIILTQAGGTLSTPVQVTHPGTDLGNGLVVGEVTGDGHLDVIVGDVAQPALIVLPGNGDGLRHGDLSPLASAPADIASGDFNEDGKRDVGVRSTAGASLAIYAGNGAGQFRWSSRSRSGRTRGGSRQAMSITTDSTTRPSATPLPSRHGSTSARATARSARSAGGHLVHQLADARYRTSSTRCTPATRISRRAPPPPSPRSSRRPRPRRGSTARPHSRVSRHKRGVHLERSAPRREQHRHRHGHELHR